MVTHNFTEPELISVSEMARKFGVSNQAGYKLVWDGKIRSVKVGKRILIPVDAIAEFINTAPSGSKKKD